VKEIVYHVLEKQFHEPEMIPHEIIPKLSFGYYRMFANTLLSC